MTGIDVSGRVIILHELEADLNAGGVATPHGLGMQGPVVPATTPSPLPPPLPSANPPQPAGTVVFTYDDAGTPIDLPAPAGPIVTAYTPGPGPSGDPHLEAIRAVPLGSTTDELRDRIVDWIEARFGG